MLDYNIYSYKESIRIKKNIPHTTRKIMHTALYTYILYK